MADAVAGNPLRPFILRQGVVILDGGLATALEAGGHDLADPLWSAKVLLEEPEAIKRVHLDFLSAGADVIATASYQASFEGFARRGLSDADAERLLRLSVELALEAREEFWAEPAHRAGRLRPLVAASVGPYGAFLADGSEYRGRYAIDEPELADFHAQRWAILADTPADLLACETIPARREAAVLAELLGETPGRWAWISVSCRDGRHLSDGSLLREVAADLAGAERLAALAINCTAPWFIDPLIDAVATTAGDTPLLVYPNQGEAWDAEVKRWLPGARDVDWAESATRWHRLGASGIGGCCRVGPAQIAAIRRALLG